MFAVLKTGGKQYKVATNDVLTIEKLAGDAGDTVEFAEILMLGGDKVTVGAPFVKGATVEAEVLEQMLGPKVVSFKKRRRKHSSQRKRGHRQPLTRVRITDISGTAPKAKAAKAEVSEPVAAEAAAAN
jgi:large subunit ribosomal protein L21